MDYSHNTQSTPHIMSINQNEEGRHTQAKEITSLKYHNSMYIK